MKLLELFNDPFPWIKVISENSRWNSEIKSIDGFYYYLYCWVNITETSKYYQWCYIGLHKSSVPVDIDYLGSSGNPLYWDSRKVDEYKLFILGYYEDSTSLGKSESKLLSKELLSRFGNRGLFNLQCGGWVSGNWDHINYPNWVNITLNGMIKSITIDELRSHSNWELCEGYWLECVEGDRNKRLTLKDLMNIPLDKSIIIRWHNGTEECHSEEAQLIANQTKLINKIWERVDNLKRLGLPLNPINYYTTLLPTIRGHSEIGLQLQHIENVCNRKYDSPSIYDHPSWDPSFTEIFDWFDDQANFESLSNYKIKQL